MAYIYTDEWFGYVRDAINAKVATLRNLPPDTLLIAVDIVGDGVSPYVAEGAERHFLVQIDGGHCGWYREGEAGEGDELNYRFRGPATVFDEIAAGLVDPIDAALKGAVRVRGDMRFLMRQADHVNALLEAYGTVATEWPLGSPPYGRDREAVDA